MTADVATRVIAIWCLAAALLAVVWVAIRHHGGHLPPIPDPAGPDGRPLPRPSDAIPAGSGVWQVHEARVLAWLTEAVRTDADPASDGLWEAAIEHAWKTDAPTRDDLAR